MEKERDIISSLQSKTMGGFVPGTEMDHTIPPGYYASSLLSSTLFKATVLA